MRQYPTIILILLLAVGCSKQNIAPLDIEPVDISDIIELYNRFLNVEDYFDEEAFEIYDLLTPEEMKAYHNPEMFEYELYDKTPFTIEIGYKDSGHPLLRIADDYFNSCVILDGILFNFSLWMDGVRKYTSEEIVQGTREINVDYLHNEQLREAARSYRDSIVSRMMVLDTIHDSPYDFGVKFAEVISQQWFQYYDDLDALNKKLEATDKFMTKKVKSKLEKYCNAETETRSGVILQEINSCQNFSEQCALLRSWSNTEESIGGDDMWIVAVATKLMSSGKYDFQLPSVWKIWRALSQSYYFGVSTLSVIPNKVYNDYRARCLVASMKYVEQHPDDELALHSVATLMSFSSLISHATDLYNQALSDEYLELPGRHK